MKLTVSLKMTAEEAAMLRALTREWSTEDEPFDDVLLGLSAQACFTHGLRDKHAELAKRVAETRKEQAP